MPPLRPGSLFVGLLLLILSTVTAQPRVGGIFITGSLTPPAPTRLEQIPDKLILQLRSQNASYNRFMLLFELKGNNGVLIRSKAVSTTGTLFFINVNELKPVVKADLFTYFEQQDFTYSGTSMYAINESGLPAGNYTLCITAYDPFTNTDITAQGGRLCLNFNIQDKEPPITLQPKCGSKLSPLPAQNVIFTWTPASGAPVWTSYTLSVIEMLNPKANPEEAIKNKANPVILEKELNTTTYIYGPADPPLVKGRTYAWTVRAKDIETQTKFKNNGQSKACTFQYGDADKPVQPTQTVKEVAQPKLTPPAISGASTVALDPKLEVTFPGLSYAMATIKGKAHYDHMSNYKSSSAALSTSGAQPEVATTAKPLPNMPISLVVAYYVDEGGGKLKPVDGYFHEYPEKTKSLPNGQSVASTVTNASGHYTFTVFLADSMGLIQKNASIMTGGGEFKKSYKGDLYRFFRIVVEDKRYLSPVNHIIVQPWNVAEVNFTGYLRNYKLKVNVATHSSQSTTYTHGTLHGMDVYLLRKSRPTHVPANEVLPEEQEGSYASLTFGTEKYEVVGKSTTDNQGNAYFYDLVKNIGATDVYYVYAQSKSNIEHNYYVPLKSFAFNLTNPEQKTGVNLECDATVVFVNTYDCNKQFDLKVAAFARKPEVYGKVMQDNKEQTTMAGVKVRLLNYAIFFASEEASTYTDSKGDYAFKNLKSPTKAEGTNVEGPIRIAEVKEAGYDKYSQLLNNGVAIPDGLKLRHDIKLKPDAVICGSVTDESGSGITAYIKVLDGSSIKVQPFKPANGNSGCDPKKPTTTTVPQALPQQIQAKPIDAKPAKTSKPDTKTPKITPTYEPVVSPQSTPIGLQGQQPAIGDIYQFSIPPAFFDMAVPSGKRTIIIEPESHEYFADTIVIDLPKGNTSFGNIVLKKKLHRVQVEVLDAGYPGSQIQLSAKPPVEKAKVSIVNMTEEKLTDKNGLARFEFGGGNTFSIRVRSPDNAYFKDIEEIVVSNIPPSKTYHTVKINLFRASFISGTVVDENGKGLQGATVKVKASGSGLLEAVSKQDGSFEIKNTPTGNGIEVSAAKEGMIGQVKKLNIPAAGLSGEQFTVRSYPEMDITELLGFPILVDSLLPKIDGAIISGRFVSLPGNSVFIPETDGQSLAFKDVYIKPGTVKNSAGIPKAVPATLPVKTEANSLKLKVNNTFFALQNDAANGLTVADAGGGSGVVKGKIAIRHSESFEDINIQFNTDSLFLTDAAGNVAAIGSLTANGNAPMSGALKLANAKGKDIKFTVYDFSADAAKSGARIEGNELILPTVLHTNISSIATPDLKVSIGELKVGKQKILPTGGSTAVNASLEQWKLAATEWSFDQNGLILKKGQLETHMANVPFTGIVVKPTALQGGDFNTTELDLKGIATLKVTGQSVLVYENKHWKLSITPKAGATEAAYIQNLPGLGNQTLKVKSSYLTSDKNGAFNMDLKPLKVYGMFDFYPNDLYFDDKLLKSSGTINMNAPNVPVKNTALVWEKTASGLNVSLQNFSFEFHTNGVDLKFLTDKESLKPNGFFCKGTLSEPGLYSMNVEYKHTSGSTKIEAVPGAELKIDATGKRKLTNIVGNMTASSGKWSNFIFEGDMTGTEGASGRLKFEIKGDITASNQKLDVKNINTPFGNLNVAFDFAKKRLTGHIDVDKEIQGTGTLKGSAEMVVDGSGWYLCAGGKITMKNNPYIKESATAMLFGDYPIAGEPFVKQTFTDYAYGKSLPATFMNQVKGFYIDGSCAVPVPYVPDIDIDLVVVAAELKVTAGGGFSLGMQFTDGAVTVNTGLAAFIEAKMKLGGSIGIACAGCSGSAKLELIAKGQISTSGQWYVDGAANLTIGASAYVGGGCCDSDCDYLGIPCPSPCFKDSWSGSKHFGITAYMGSDGNHIKVNF